MNLTIPLATLLGLAHQPGQVGGFGPADPALARDLATAAAAHPATRWCLTITGPGCRALGHGCALGQHPATILTSQTTPAPARRAARPPTRSEAFTVTITPLAQHDCDHRHQEPGYQPSRALQHLIRARTTTCTAPGCRRPAAACDLDHTVPYDQGGRTCECNLAPRCNR